MKYVNDFGIAPTRGTSKSVGIDFFVPDAHKWNDENIKKFESYLKEKEMYDYFKNVICIKTPQYIAKDKGMLYNICILFLSHRGQLKETASILPKTDYMNWFKQHITIDCDLKLQDTGLIVKPGESVCIPSGIRTMFEKNMYGEFENKSGMGMQGWNVQAKVIDEDYTGYVHCNLANVSNRDLVLYSGGKIAQLIERPAYYNEISEIPEDEYFEKMRDSERGSGAFGSTGK